jgi:DNA-binding MarR family transcriptional regulator
MKSQPALSLEVKEFISEHIHSVEQLQVLMLIHEAPERTWDAVEVSRQLGIDPIAASNRLMDLHLRGLLEHKAGAGKLYHYRYRPVAKRLAKLVEALRQTFAGAQVQLIDYVNSQRREEMKEFSEAFRWSKDRQSG